MDAINLALLVVGTLVFASVFAGLYSARAGLSFLLVFLIVGMLAGVPQARVLFDIAFVVVLVSLVFQGATLVRAARAFGVNLPEPGNERAERRIYGDFALDGDESLGPWFARRLKRAPVVGDRIDWGGAAFMVRAMEDGRITRIGLVIEGMT